MKNKIILACTCILAVYLFFNYKQKLQLIYFIVFNEFVLQKSIDKFYLNKTEINVPLHSNTWLHKVNNINKLNNALDRFSGFECDIYFNTDKSRFEVRHWPEDEFIGLTLDNYFDFIMKSNKSPYIWLDFKNLKFLSHRDINNSILNLEKIINKFKIKKDKIIIESQNPAALQKYKAQKFHCSYWIPHIKPNLISTRDLIIWSEQIKKNLIKYNLKLISMDVSMYPYSILYLANVQKMIWGNNRNTVVHLTD